MTLAGVLLLCLDAPTYRLVQLRTPAGTAAFGYAFAVYRGFAAFWFACATSLGAEGGSAHAARHQVALLGTWRLLLGGVLLGASSVAFTLALSLTSVANLLVINAACPLVAALLGRLLLGAELPRHTWGACVVGFVSVAVVFAGSLSASAGGLGGLLVAAGCPLAFSSFLTLCAFSGDLSLAFCNAPGGVFVTLFGIIALGGRLGGAAPVTARDGMLLIVNVVSNALANILLTIGSSMAPAPEVALTSLLETALGPLLVYVLVGERPGNDTLAAGALIVVTLAAHSAYDLRLARHGTTSDKAGRLLEAAPPEG